MKWNNFTKISLKEKKIFDIWKKKICRQLFVTYIPIQPLSKFLFTQAEQPGFKCWLFFPRSVTNRRLGSTAHASLMHAYDTWNLQKLSSCKATSSDAMISRVMKSHTNEHTVRGRPTLKVVKHFRKGSVCTAYER